jgi:serine/threonine protein kinase
MKNVIACLENYIHGLRFFRVPHQCSLSLDSTVLKELTLPYSARETSFGAMGTIICDSSLKHVRCLEDRLEVWSRFWDEEEEEEEREENDDVLLRNSIYFNDGRPIQVKIVDLGNSCWRDEHFSEDIQTRQYRCPEVILANGYDTPADMWSYACLLFELYTGDILFDPKADDHGSFSRDEDHIAQAQELLGVIPRHISRKSKIGRSFFNRNGEMIRIKDLKFWKMKDVLMEKYGKEETEAEIFADFLEKCMAFNPDHRATARQCLDHPFLNSTKWFSSKARREGNDDDLDRSMTSRSPRK